MSISKDYATTLGVRALRGVRRRIARPLLHTLAHRILHRRIERPSEVSFLGHRLRTEPEVFHPTYFSSSRVLATELLARPVEGLRVLDMGTGSGPVGVALAARGGKVTACDVNPRAVALARENARRNAVPVEVLESDLFAALDGRRFDLIAFNVPFYPTVPRTHFEAAFRAGPGLATVGRFAAACPAHLAPDGRVVIVFSEDCDRPTILGAFEGAGFSLETEERTRRMLEEFSVATFRFGTAS